VKKGREDIRQVMFVCVCVCVCVCIKCMFMFICIYTYEHGKELLGQGKKGHEDTRQVYLYIWTNTYRV
jgi:hypothetical protein